jgi:hypothetical protein
VSALKAEPGERSQSFGKLGISLMSRSARVRVGQVAALIHHGLEHSLISLAETRQKRARTSVKEATPILVN